MKKHSFLKQYFIHSYKYLFDFSYLFIVFILSCACSIGVVVYTSLNWNKNLQFYGVSVFDKPDYLFWAGNFFICFFVMILTSLVFRFFTNLLFFKSGKDFQRAVSILLTSFYLFTTLECLYSFGQFNSSFLILSKNLNFIVLIYFIYCSSFYFYKNKFFLLSEGAKFFFILSLIFIIIGIDWFVVHYSQKKFLISMKNTEYYFIFASNQGLDNQSISNFPVLTISSLDDFFKDENIKNSKIEINNLGDPKFYSSIKKFNFSSENICSNDVVELKKYRLLKNIIPITNFFPTRILVDIYPNQFCLNLGKNFADIVLYGVYSNNSNAFDNNDEKRSSISIINMNQYSSSKEMLWRNFDILINSFPEIKAHLHFYSIP